MGGFDPCQVIDRLNELQKQIYDINRIYTAPLSGLSVTIRPDQHHLTVIRNYRMYNREGYSGLIQFRVLGDLTCVIESNVDLTGNTIEIY